MLFRRIWIIMDVCNKSTIGGDLDMKAVALWISTGPFLSEGFWREGRPRFFLLQYRPGELVPCDFVWLVKVSLEVLLQNTYKSRSKTAKKGSERSLFPSLTSGSSASISNLIFYVTPTLSILAICHGHPVKLPVAVGQWDGQNGLVGKGPHNLGKVMWRISAKICREL